VTCLVTKGDTSMGGALRIILTNLVTVWRRNLIPTILTKYKTCRSVQLALVPVLRRNSIVAHAWAYLDEAADGSNVGSFFAKQERDLIGVCKLTSNAGAQKSGTGAGVVEHPRKAGGHLGNVLVRAHGTQDRRHQYFAMQNHLPPSNEQ
jgi:hypothetical protein